MTDSCVDEGSLIFLLDDGEGLLWGLMPDVCFRPQAARRGVYRISIDEIDPKQLECLYFG